MNNVLDLVKKVPEILKSVALSVVKNDAGSEKVLCGDGVYREGLKADSYFGDMNALVTSGVYRVGTNSNLDPQLWYGQVFVMKGTDTDTLAQLGMDYTNGKIVARSASKATGSWVFSPWATFYSDKNKPTAADIGALPNTGGALSGPISIGNQDEYIGLTKVRKIDGTLFYNVFGIGSDTRGASASMRLTDGSGNTKGRIDLWVDGTITYTPNGSTYYVLYGEHNFSSLMESKNIPQRVEGSVSITGGAANTVIDLPFTPRLVVVHYAGYDAMVFVAGYESVRGINASNYYRNWYANISRTSNTLTLWGEYGKQPSTTGTVSATTVTCYYVAFS